MSHHDYIPGCIYYVFDFCNDNENKNKNEWKLAWHSTKWTEKKRRYIINMFSDIDYDFIQFEISDKTQNTVRFWILLFVIILMQLIVEIEAINVINMNMGHVSCHAFCVCFIPIRISNIIKLYGNVCNKHSVYILLYAGVRTRTLKTSW